MTAGENGESRSWLVERLHAPAAQLHARATPTDGRRRIWLLEPTGPAVVLGSTQSDDVVDREAAFALGVDVVRRRSGGGAVWVAPDEPVWVDVLLPRHDPLWDDDVARSFLPVGRAWARALETCGVGRVAVHEGPMERSAWSDLICFAGRGAGEVFRDGRKVVGMSQRRDRAGARFQCALPRVWDPDPLRLLVRPTPPREALADAGTGIGEVTTESLVAALVAALG